MKEADMKKTYRWICLQKALGYGSRKIKEILKIYKTSEEFFKASKEEWSKCRLFTARELQKLLNFDYSIAEKIEETCDKKGYKIVTYEDDNYPSKLKGIYNPPAVLYVNGSFPKVDKELAIAIVGTRSATTYGLKTSFDFAYNLAKKGVIIISGGALGVDTSAQKGAVLAGGKVISVLGCGIDCKYLKKNDDLKKTIAKSGAVISEYEPDYPVIGRNFPIRNRIIAALSHGTLIVEAGQKSGALITANLALEQNRDLFAIPGDIRSEVSLGTNNLIKECAKPVTQVEDILEEYYLRFPDLGNKINSERLEKIVDDSDKNIESVDRQRDEIQNAENENLNISKRAKIIYNLLERDRAFVFDEIAILSGLNAADVLQGITELEVKKLIYSGPGKQYRKK